MRFSLSILALLWLASCGDDGGAVSVDLRSDLLSGVEVGRATIFVDDGMRETYALERTTALLRGVRVARFEGISGRHTVRVELSSPSGERVAERRVTVDVRGETVTTVVFTRSCLAVVCPGADSDATECNNGECVSPECSPEHPDRCGSSACSDTSNCPMPMSACAEAACDEGACFLQPIAGSCGAEDVCSPDEGCISVSPDAGSPDAGDVGVPDDGGRDVGTPDARDASVDVAIDVFDAAAPDTSGFSCAGEVEVSDATPLLDSVPGDYGSYARLADRPSSADFRATTAFSLDESELPRVGDCSAGCFGPFLQVRGDVPGVVDRGDTSVDIAAGARFRLRFAISMVGRSRRAFVYFESPACVNCPSEGRECDVDMACYAPGNEYCLECEGRPGTTCACIDARGMTSPDGTACTVLLGDAIASGTCRGGECEF